MFNRSTENETTDEDVKVSFISTGVWMIKLPEMSVGTICNIAVDVGGK